MKREYSKEAFVKRLGGLIKRKQLTRAQAADDCGVSRGAMENYLHNGSQPTAENLAKLAVGIGVSADYLLFGVVHRA